MRLSAVVCTYNRSRLARRALESLAVQSLGAEGMEVILVDDGSADSTPAMASDFGRGRTNFQYVRQSNQGLSASRNEGWRRAKAPIVAFLDDDAVADCVWAMSFADAFQRHPIDVACAGGPIGLEWERPRPNWLDEESLRWLGHLDRGPEEIVSFDRGDLLTGGNMAFRRTALEEIGGFSVALGRKGTNLLSQEESAAIQSARTLGLGCVYVPAASIRHWVPADRLRQGWFRRRLFWEGISMARQEFGNGRDPGPIKRRLRALNQLRSQLCRRDVVGTVFMPWTWPGRLRWQNHVCFQIGRAIGMMGSPHNAR